MENKKVLLKICGIRSQQEMEELVNLNIDYFGCIFASNSPRKVTIELATVNSQIAHSTNKKVVGVFVNESVDNIVNTAITANLDAVQLHSDENIEFVKQLHSYFEIIKSKTGKNIKIWKVLRIDDYIPDFEEFKPYIEYILFDAKGKDLGGNGISFDWAILENIDFPFILAGGLSKENITTALNYHPSILDVNSKVEINNKKSKHLIEEIISIIR
jgi:phosphoribosylanthranilate isomerase